MKKILVVEDESIIAMELELHLTEMGYEVVGIASSGVEAIAKARELRPDLILMDIVMPGEKNGIDAATEIKSEMDVPIIFVTAYADEERIKRAKTVEPFGYIVKPYEDREVRATIEVALYKKEMESKLQEEKNRVELLTDILGHDIRNLNQGILSYMELLLTTPDLPEKFNGYIRTAFEQSKGITKLVSNVRKLLELQKQGLKLKNIDVFPLFIHAIDEVKTAYSQKELEIKCELSENEVVVLGNELLEEVFYNILDNAVKYDRHDTVEVEVNSGKVEDGKYWKVEFKDNGPGIPDEIKERIFTRLERLDKKAFATGLGLTLVKQIIEKCGGKVWVEDRIKGDRTKGSNFVVMLASADGGE
jgi:signal transduction histidine kinase